MHCLHNHVASRWRLADIQDLHDSTVAERLVHLNFALQILQLARIEAFLVASLHSYCSTRAPAEGCPHCGTASSAQNPLLQLIQRLEFTHRVLDTSAKTPRPALNQPPSALEHRHRHSPRWWWRWW